MFGKFKKNSKCYWLTAVAFTILIGTMCFTVLYQPEPEIITRVVYESAPPPEIIYVVSPAPDPIIKIVEVVKEVPIEVVKEVPIKTKGFETVAEFEKWVDENHALLAISFVGFNKHDPQNDCEDQADRWQLEALEEYGYLVSACPVYNGMVFDTYVGGGKYHVGLWTSIGNEYFYWESVTGKITKLNVVRD